MTHFVLSVAAFIVTIGILVSFHEFGHFWVARRFGIKVLRYSIGFGRPFASFKGRAPDRTEYWLSWIPLGGYVKLLDEREAPVPEAERARAFNHRPAPQRIAVMLAGPAFNFLFAILAYWLLFVVGVPALKPYIGDVTVGSIAATAGIKAQDQIQSVDGVKTGTWNDARLRLLDAMLGGGAIPMTVEDPNGNVRRVQLDVRGKISTLSSPGALLPGLGIEPGLVLPPVIGSVVPGEPADRAGLEPGDRVLAMNGRPISSFDAWANLIKQHEAGDVLKLRIERDGREIERAVTVEPLDLNGQSSVGIGVGSSTEVPQGWQALAQKIRTEQRYGPGAAFVHGIDKTWEMSSLTVRMLARMVVGQVSPRTLSGPIAIATYAGDSVQEGFGAFLGFLAIVSISLGILNLLPIPLLDGGQVAYQLVEWVKGSPLSERAMLLGQELGMGLLILLMGFVFYNDLTRVFS